MNMFRAPLISAAVLAMTSCATFAQVRIITPDSEHLYSTDPRTPGSSFPTMRPFGYKTNAPRERRA